jgi:hydroxymethylpyrimidine pyrophosphatase-like HAD family hydrolase
VTDIRVIYTDLDGTMVGPYGCFFRAEDGALTDEPARALLDLLAADVTLVLVSGRTRPQMLEAARIFGAEGYIAEMGSVIGWDHGREADVLRGAMPEAYQGTPAAVMEGSGILAELFARYAGMLEYHSPWHLGHEADVMLRGQIDAADADGWLSERGYGWLRVRDNGVLPPHRSTTLRPEAAPVHVYHLMPDGVTKGLAIARDLQRRGVTADAALAIGDSASDLEMAPYVRELWLTANGAAHGHMPALVASHPNVRISPAAVGLGWAEAIRAALA